MTLMRIRIAGLVLVGVGCVAPAGRTVVAQAGQQVSAQIIPPDQEDEFIKGSVSFKTPGLVQPRVTRQTHPKYPPAALRAKLQGEVKLEAIIGVDGRVEKSRAKEPLDPDLDAEALKTLDTWEFEPGRLNDVPVRVLVEVVMAFQVR